MALENNKIEKSSIDNEEISLKELIIKIKEWASFIISKWKTTLIIGIIGGLIGLTVALFEKPVYKAQLTFAMEDDKSNGGLGGALSIASNLGIDIGGSNSSGGGGAFAASNLAELMKSRLIVEKTLLNQIQIGEKATTLAEYYISINELRKNWINLPELRSIQFLSGTDRNKYTIQQDSILNTIYKKLIDRESLSIMQKDKKISILSIEVKNKNELFSKLFCESLAKETSNFYIETKSKKSRINVDILQKQVDSVKSALNGAIIGMAFEVDNVYNLNPSLNVKGAESKKRQVDVQANTSILTNMVVQLELAKITLRKETPLIQLIDHPILPLEKEQYGKVKLILMGGILTGLIYILYLIFGRLYTKMIE